MFSRDRFDTILVSTLLYFVILLEVNNAGGLIRLGFCLKNVIILRKRHVLICFFLSNFVQHLWLALHHNLVFNLLVIWYHIHILHDFLDWLRNNIK